MADKYVNATGLRAVIDWIIGKLSGKSDTGHTHNYAGASTAGGSATSAVKLDTSAGNATTPVYFSGGKPVSCSYSLQKSVPSDAVFTDTNTWRGIQNNLTSDSTTDSLAAAQGKALKKLVDGKAASSHKHTKSDITDMPTSLPAKGGNADTATKLATARTIALTGSVTGSGAFDGSGNLSIATTTNHAHGLLHSDFTSIISDTTTDNGWSMINSSYHGYILKSIRTSKNAPSWILGNYSAGIAFGGSDTKGVLSLAYPFPIIRFAGGNGTKPVWNISLTGTSGSSYNLDNFAASSHTHADLVQIIDCPDGTDSKICIGTSGKTTIYRCAGSTAFTDVPELHTRQGTIIAINFSGGGTAGSNVMWVKQIFVSAHAQTYVRYIDGSGVGSWCRDVIDIVIGTSSAQIAYKTGYTKALIEFWKTLVGTGTTASTCSSTVYDSVLVTDLSSSMTAVNGKSISSGPDFSFVYSISTGGAITPSGNFSKYRITYFN